MKTRKEIRQALRQIRDNIARAGAILEGGQPGCAQDALLPISRAGTSIVNVYEAYRQRGATDYESLAFGIRENLAGIDVMLERDGDGCAEVANEMLKVTYTFTCDLLKVA